MSIIRLHALIEFNHKYADILVSQGLQHMSLKLLRNFQDKITNSETPHTDVDIFPIAIVIPATIEVAE